MNRLLMLFILNIMLFTGAYAQSLQINGLVVDSDSGEPLIGVAVVDNETKKGTITDFDGKFSLKASKGSTLSFSYLGYKNQSLKIGSKTYYEVKLATETQEIDEVVVVGYGVVKKTDLTGSVSSVKADKLKGVAITNADQMLQGRVAGVQVTQNSGAPGGAASIRVRGASSINSSNEPLYVVDGIPFSGQGTSIGGFDWAGGSNGQTATNPLATISPQDIISIDVLKDASATAIYGAAGANGVVIINTRRGQEGKMTLNYDGQVAVQGLANGIDMMNLQQYAQYAKDINELYSSAPVDDMFLDPSLLGMGTNWQDEIFREAMMHSHSLSMTGGSDKLKYAASIGYMNQDGTIYGSNFERYNARFNVDGTIKPWLKAGGTLAYTRTDETITRQDGNDGVIMQALTMQPSVPVYNFDGTYAGPTSVYGSSAYNPLWLAEMQNNTLLRSRVMGNFYLQADILKSLNFRSEYGYDVSTATNKSFIPTYDFGNGVANSLNQMRQQENQSLFWIWKNYLTFNKSFKKHTLNVMAGVELQSSSWEAMWITKSGFSNDFIHVMTSDGTFGNNNGNKDAARKASAFARANYNYADRYLLTGTIRADGSSKFGPNNKWGYFPSAAVAWKVSNEAFLKDVSWISELKFRVGYGMVGNDNISTYAYGSTMTSMPSSLGSSAYRVTNISNPNLKWESSEQYNIGIDFSVLERRISIVADMYRKHTNDLLMQVSVPSYTGIGDNNGVNIAAPIVNIGAVENKGFDIAINTYPIMKPNFTWGSNLIISKNINKVTALNNDTQVITGGVDTWFGSAFKNASIIKVGQPMGVFYGYKTAGYFRDEADVLSSAVQVEDAENLGQNLFNLNSGVYVGDLKFEDLSGDGIIDDKDQTIIGDPNPDFTFGWNNTFTYKQFDLSIGLNGVVGGDILNIARFRTESLNNQWDNQGVQVVNRAQIAYDDNGAPYLGNPETASTPRIALNDINNNNRMSDRWLEDGSYLRIQNITLSYTLNRKAADKIRLQNLKIYGTVQNVYTFTNYSGYDPEIGAFNQSAIMQNYDMGRYPSPRMYIIGLTLGF